ncbi:MAG: hypothetical protein US63_C0011G0023 [Candidatus Moranbacteria bacterium GW2011_GWC2_37_8]|nr:MAG: hypothetical protein US63_C0011G0023 [Candidatus Moranbacteria bacterium GW2011_GWC2_37_8]KKQ62309.1 MAG: hypothetical protein US82_C0014G0020 [Parcubacteria group bacterium GW2011_GWC1_38_22]
MELKKWPETEMEYWTSIEGLGGFVWRMNHDLADGRIEESKGMNKDLKDAQEIMEKLVSEIFIKFSVVAPQNCPRKEFDKEMPKAPEGQIWYRDWCNKMKKEAYAGAYAKIICSACPLSEGLEKYISLGQVPCGVFSGYIYELRKPYECAMLSSHWTREKLLAEIQKEGGDDAVSAFEKKEKELKDPPSVRLLALYPELVLDREVATKVLVDKSWPHQAEALDNLPSEATLKDLLSTFIHDSSAEEFLWHYIEALTGEKEVHNKTY